MTIEQLQSPQPTHCQSYCAGFAFLMKNPPPKGFRWATIFHFLMATARVMPPAVLAKNMGPARHCYMNASRTVIREWRKNVERYIYCEGLAVPSDVPIPLSHAWVIDKRTGGVIETTWRKPGLEYFGIAFTRDFLRTSLLRRKHFGLIDAPELDFPLLRMPAGELTIAMHPHMNELAIQTDSHHPEKPV